MDVLYFDTESSDLSASFGRILCASFAINDGEVFTLRGDEKEYRGRSKVDDSKLVVAIREVIETADILVGWNCLAAGQRVLTDDLRWVEAGELMPGDGLAAFDESGGVNCPRRLRRATVSENMIRDEQCFEVGLEGGDVVIATASHPWLTASGRLANNHRWSRTDRLLRNGDARVLRLFDPWGEPDEYDMGWLAGFLDGEGTISAGPGPTVSFYQKAGPLFDRAMGLMHDYGFDVGRDSPRQALGGETLCGRVHGGWQQTATLLGTIRPRRLLENFDWDKAGTLKSRSTKHPRVEYVEPVGSREIAVLGSTSGTYVAEGFAMHNSIRHDVPLLDARLSHPRINERPIRNGEKHGSWHVDGMYYVPKIGGRSLKKASEYYKCQNEKTPLDGEVWQEAGAGEPGAMDLIVEHCEADVIVMREVMGYLWRRVKKLKFDLSEVYPFIEKIESRR